MERIKYSRKLNKKQRASLHNEERTAKITEDLLTKFLSDKSLNKESKKLASCANRHIKKFLKELGVKVNKERFENVPDIVLTKPKQKKGITKYGSLAIKTGNIFVYKQKVYKEDVKSKMLHFVGKIISNGHSRDSFYEIFGNSAPKIKDKELNEKQELITAIHELYHYRSTRFRYYSTDNEMLRFIWKTGICSGVCEENPDGSSVIKRHFNLLNEGITDELALLSANLNPSTEKEMRKKGYRTNRIFFNLLVSTMANKEEVGVVSVFRDWVDVYLNGWTPEFKRRLIATFGDDVLERLAYLSETDMQGWMEDMLYEHASKEKREKINVSKHETKTKRVLQS